MTLFRSAGTLMLPRGSPPQMICLVQCAEMNHLHEFVVITVIHRHADDHRALHLESLLQSGCDLIRSLNHQTLSAECLRESNYIDRTKLGSRGAFVFRELLKSDHVISAINPNHVDEVAFQPNGGFEFRRRKQESTIARDGDHLFTRPRKTCRNRPRQADPERLLPVGHENLPSTEAV